MDTVESYALKILADSGCDCYSYGNVEDSEILLEDLKTEYPDGMKYPYIDVANAILAISRPRPIKKSPWRMVWENEHSCDGIDYDSFEAAKEQAIETLVEWQVQFLADRKFPKKLEDMTEEQKEDWNYMISECRVSVYKYNADKDEYEEYWYPSYEDEKEINWIEIK